MAFGSGVLDRALGTRRLSNVPEAIAARTGLAEAGSTLRRMGESRDRRPQQTVGPNERALLPSFSSATWPAESAVAL